MSPQKRERGPLDRPAFRNSSSTTDQSDRPKGTAGEQEFAVYEARVRTQAIERVVCSDLTHGRGLDDDTAVWVASMAGQVDRWLERAQAAA